MIKLVVGLGNPGLEHEFNRHNIGWLALDQLSFFDKLTWKEKFKGRYSQLNLLGENRYFLKPDTYMNLSGESVQKLISFFKIQVEEILVVHDELDLKFGEVAFKKGGGLAGHNGLKSIAQLVGSQNFLRFRMGIGRPKHGNVASYVLSNFSNDEEISLEKYLGSAAKAIESSLEKGFDKAAGLYSKKLLIE